ncbi:MAG: carbon-nitrogen hydrolase family protein [Candidatus Njordarchaeia archaeon]
MTREISIGLVQPRLQVSIKDALDNAGELLNFFAENHVDFIVFPESWLLLGIYKKVEELINSYEFILDFLVEKAKVLDSHIIGGALYKREEGEPYIVAPVISRTGGVVGEQYKINLFRIENEYFLSKPEINVFNLDGLKFGVMICYDANFPEISRILLKKGADIIFNPSRIIADGEDMWHIYLAARSLENRLPIVGVNVFYPGQYNGRSIVLVPETTPLGVVKPRIAADLGSRQNIDIVKINVDSYQGIKRKRLREVLKLEKILSNIK